jgi:NDP-sugar pyrophosphorylase family protein
MEAGQEIACQEIKEWTDLSYPWDLLSANKSLLAGLEPSKQGEVEANVTINGTVAIGQKTIIRSGAYINGPVIIGEGCEIGPNCFIRPATSIGDFCHIGAAVEVKNSIIMKGTKIPHHNYVGDSVIGEQCNLGAGTKIANLRLDKKNIGISGVDTGRRKLGAIIGDHVETGINASINVGCVIGNNTFIGPGAVVSGVISPNSKIL